MKDYANNQGMCRRDVLFLDITAHIRDLYAYVVMCV